MFKKIEFCFRYIIKIVILGFKYPPKIIKKILLRTKHPFNSNLKIKYYKMYSKYIYKKLYPFFCKSLEISCSDSKNPKENSGIIWIFWWQGYKSMPKIVKVCYKSVLKHSNGHRVILITKKNIKKYTNISNFIYIKLYKHDMTLTHFSDILRFNLLKNYGGLWIDSTVFCSNELDNKYFHDIYTSGGYSVLQSRKVFANKWTEFLIGGKKDDEIFKFMDTFFNLYWKRKRYLLDYFLVDYALDYAYHKNISGFKDYVDNIADKNNPHLYDLVDYLNKPFNINIYNEISNNTNLFKLTYKQRFNNSNNTFYNKLINYRL